MLWQRFGRGARDKELQATALLFVEPKDLDQVDPPKGRKRKAAEKDQKSRPKSKRARKEKPTPMRLDTSVASEEEFWEARRAVYHEPIDDENSKKAELNHVLGDVINADVRGICCRQKPFKVYFDDDECSGLWIFICMFGTQQCSSGTHECNNAVDGPCPRCSPRPPRICCDLCNPEEFKDMFQVFDPAPKTQLRRSQIKDYIPTESDKNLRKWLDDWRRKTSKEVHGEYCVRYYGPLNIMLDDTFERICDAAHHNLITSVDDLYKETRWHLTYEYGQTIIEKIKEIILVDLPPSTAPHPVKQPQPRKCSSCGQVGHTSELSMQLSPISNL